MITMKSNALKTALQTQTWATVLRRKMDSKLMSTLNVRHTNLQIITTTENSRTLQQHITLGRTVQIKAERFLWVFSLMIHAPHSLMTTAEKIHIALCLEDLVYLTPPRP